jgi:superfamily II DNA or RNA helicase
MLTNIKYSESLEYSSDGNHLPIEFFMLTIPECKKIDLKLGYFSSNAIRTLAYGFAQFIQNGGILRIITNHFLSIKDKLLISDDIIESYVQDEEIKYIINNELEELAKILERGDQHFFDCLKYLLRHNRLIIIPVKLKPHRLAHFKQGILNDGINQVYFNGSCNFTYRGLVDNGESLSIARSWGENSEKIKVKDNTKIIEKICSKEDEGFVYLNPDQIIAVIEENGKDKQLDELVEDEKNVYEKLSRLPYIKKIFFKYASDFQKKVKEEKQKPKFPYPNGPRPYQIEAYQKWLKNGRRGIFAMATGTGKTITSLNCLLNEYKDQNYYKAVILVPTIALVDQWKKECYKFNFKNIIQISSKENWNDELSFFNTANKLVNASFIVIITYASFVRKKFQNHFKQFSRETILIADELHNMGAPCISKLLAKIHLNKRIGLSATPERKYDIEGNIKIDQFFNDKAPYIFNFSMKQALKMGWLCKYKYFPHTVTLDDDELNEYIQKSFQLLKFIDSTTGKYKDCPEVETLLLARKRIIHKARNKKSIFNEILNNEFRGKGNIKYTLIYVPEGKDPDYSKTDEYIEEDNEEKLIREYTKIVRDIDLSILVKQYTARTKNRSEVIKDFEHGKIHVLTSMKCLDEGVDVPRSELAIFCASTGNPRQFIQRRGRVLRLHKNKVHSTIHDLVVVPKIDKEQENFEMERNLFKKELERIVDFSSLSMNKIDTYEELKNILEYYNLNLYDFEEQ